MNYRKRKRRRLLLLLSVLLLVGLLLLIRLRLAPLIEALSLTMVRNETAGLINDAINEQIAAGNIQYDRIITLEKNLDGQITALKTDMSEVNRLKTEILDVIDEQILDMSVEELGIPLGSLLSPTLLSGRGPSFPVKLMCIKSSGASFFNDFSEAGINQTLHEILLTVGVTVTVLTPAGTMDVDVDSQVVVAQTILVGEVPDTVVNITQPEETG